MGVYVWGPDAAMVRANRIVGNTELRVAERGNGVSVWNSPGTQVLDNDISAGRDGIFSNTSKHNLFRGNRFRHLRYAVHYMYTNDSEVSDNISEDNDIGYAIMYSHRSEEHTSELQSLMRISYAVFCLKKKIYQKNTTNKSSI